MTEMFPRFQKFADREFFTNAFDYLVPIETKGILILDELVRSRQGTYPTILFRRAFDFLTKDELSLKSAALIDDAVVLGRTLLRSESDLNKKGMAKTAKFAFILLDDAKYAADRRLEGIKCCTTLDSTQYSLILEELSGFSMRTRPSYPDHLVIHAQLAESYPTDAIFDVSRRSGTLVEYDNSEFRSCSIHYPSFTPKLPDYAYDTGPNKLRVSFAYSGDRLTFSPGIFPALKASALPGAHDELWLRFYRLLDRPWHEEDTKLLDVYESFTIATRVRMMQNFLGFLWENGIKTKHLDIDTRRLKCYYGDKVSEQIAQAVLDEGCRRGSRARMINPELCEKMLPSVDIYSLCQSLLKEMDRAYRNANEHVSDRFDWASRGLNILQLSEASGLPMEDASIGAELLNNYGYSTPCFYVGQDTERLERVYRTTEIGTIRLQL